MYIRYKHASLNINININICIYINLDTNNVFCNFDLGCDPLYFVTVIRAEVCGTLL